MGANGLGGDAGKGCREGVRGIVEGDGIERERGGEPRTA